MEVVIHWEVDGVEDSLTLIADTIGEIRGLAKGEVEKRGLDVEKNNCWSELLNQEDKD